MWGGSSLTERINLRHGNRLEPARSFKPKIEAADSSEQGKDAIRFPHARPQSVMISPLPWWGSWGFMRRSMLWAAGRRARSLSDPKTTTHTGLRAAPPPEGQDIPLQHK